MSVSYKKLLKIIIDKDMKRKDLIEHAKVSEYTISKLSHGENVTTDVWFGFAVPLTAYWTILLRFCRKIKNESVLFVI